MVGLLSQWKEKIQFCFIFYFFFSQIISYSESLLVVRIRIEKAIIALLHQQPHQLYLYNQPMIMKRFEVLNMTINRLQSLHCIRPAQVQIMTATTTTKKRTKHFKSPIENCIFFFYLKIKTIVYVCMLAKKKNVIKIIVSCIYKFDFPHAGIHAMQETSTPIIKIVIKVERLLFLFLSDVFMFVLYFSFFFPSISILQF